MAYPVHYVPAGDVLPIFFSTFDGGTGASITMTGLAVTDIEIYRDGSTTQRASDAGYTLLDTDGIDFDSLTGIHGFSIDTGDNTDSGFYTVGSWFHVVVSAVTVDAQTVSFVAAAFRIMAAEGVAGVPDVNATHWNDTAVTTPPAVNVTQLSGDSTAADNAEAFFDGTGYAGTNNVIPTVTTLTGHTAQTGDAYARLGAPAGASVSADIAAVKSDTAAILVDTGTTLPATLDTIDNFLDTEIAAILADTNELQTDWANGGRLDLLLDNAAAGGAAASFGIVHEGTAQSATGTTLVLASGAAFANDELIGATILITGGTGVGQARIITDYVGSTDTATVDTWTTTPSGTITYKVFGTPPASATSVPAVNVTQWLGTACATPTTAGVPEVDVTHCSGSAQATIATQASVNTIDDFLDTEVAAILAAVDTEVAAILADTNELQTDWANGGRLDLLLDGAASAGDPWTTSLPGAYGAGTAGYIVGTNLDGTVSSRASQTSVDTVDDLLDTEVAAIKTVVDSILVDTAEIGAAGAGLTALATQASVNTIDDLLDTEVAAIKTAVDDILVDTGTTLPATLATISGYVDTEVAAVLAAVDTEVAAIKAKTDSLTFTVAGQVDANIQSINDVALTGDGSATPWGPA